MIGFSRNGGSSYFMMNKKVNRKGAKTQRNCKGIVLNIIPTFLKSLYLFLRRPLRLCGKIRFVLLQHTEPQHFTQISLLSSNLHQQPRPFTHCVDKPIRTLLQHRGSDPCLEEVVLLLHTWFRSIQRVQYA